jgi:hypothetical protein
MTEQLRVEYIPLKMVTCIHNLTYSLISYSFINQQ